MRIMFPRRKSISAMDFYIQRIVKMKKPKKIKLLNSSKKSVKSSDQHITPAETGLAEKAPKIISDIIEFVDAPEGSKRREQYLAIAGRGRPLDDLVDSNFGEDSKISKALLKDIEQISTVPSVEIGIQIKHYNVTPGSAVEIDISAARKVAPLYRNASVDVIAAIRIMPVPCDLDAHGFGMSVDVVSIVFGRDASTAVKQANQKSRSRKPGRLEQSSLEWLDPNDGSALKKAFSQLMRPRLYGPLDSDNSSLMILQDDWDRDEARALRGLVTLMCLSMLPMKKKLIVSGEGKPIVTGAIADAEHRLGKLCKGSPPVIHRDGVAHFWFSELRRLGLDDISVPLVKLR